MSLFQLKWLRRFVRKNTNPISLNEASRWKQRLSIGYAFFAWNAFGFMMYAVYQGKADWAKDFKSKEELALTPAQSFAKQFKIEKASVVRLGGAATYNTYEIDNTEDNGEENQQSSETGVTEMK